VAAVTFKSAPRPTASKTVDFRRKQIIIYEKPELRWRLKGPGTPPLEDGVFEATGGACHERHSEGKLVFPNKFGMPDRHSAKRLHWTVEKCDSKF
jgi:hypothetical protein